MVQRLIEELDGTPSVDEVLGEPKIFEDYVGATPRFSVTVIWDPWSTISPADRNQVILDAYEHSGSRKSEIDSINAVLGLTKSEAVDFGVWTPE